MPRRFVLLFLMLAMPTGILFAVLNPPGLVPDELSHATRVMGAAHGKFAGRRVWPAWSDHPLAGVIADDAFWKAVPGRSSKDKVDADTIDRQRSVQWSAAPKFLPISTIAVYSPIFYLPAAVAVRLAQFAGVIPFDAFVIGRMAALLVFVVMVVWALQVARRGRALLFCTVSMPLTLMLAGSLNQDSLLIASSVLAAALTTAPTPRRRVVAAVLIGCIGAAKPPYLPLAILLLLPLPLPGQWRAMRPELLRRSAIGLVAVGLPLVWVSWMLATVSTPTHSLPYLAGPLWPGPAAQVFTGTDPQVQIQVLLKHPLRFLTLPLSTLLRSTWPINEAIGVLGALDLLLPGWLYRVWMWAVPLAVLADACRREERVRATESILLIAAAILTIWAFYISQYLTWSEIGLNYIEGPTGRNFLPILPLIALAIPRLRVGGWPRIQALMSTVPAIAVLCGLIALPSLLVSTYYLR